MKRQIASPGFQEVGNRVGEGAGLIITTIGLRDDAGVVVGPYAELQEFLRLSQLPGFEFVNEHGRHCYGAGPVTLYKFLVASVLGLRDRADNRYVSLIEFNFAPA